MLVGEEEVAVGVVVEEEEVVVGCSFRTCHHYHHIE